MRVGLVERAMGGDQEAFAALAAESVDGCYRLAYRILRDPHRAQRPEPARLARPTGVRAVRRHDDWPPLTGRPVFSCASERLAVSLNRYP